MKKIIFTVLLIGWAWLVHAQSIQKVEYFIDTDPGFGNGVNVPITAGATVTTNLNIPLAVGLSNGFHKFYVRAKDSNGAWSMVFFQNFFKTDDFSTLNNISKLEYFIDTDPGFNQGINVPITASTNITQGLSIPLLANLPLGFHKFFIRAKDASGKWSVVHQQNFFKTDDLPTLSNVVKLEYFIGSDPGFGQATNFPLTANTTISLNDVVFSIPENTAFGSVSITIRAMDASGKWSIVGIKNFTNCPGVTINAPNGVISCSTPIELNAQLQAPELGGTLQWFRNGVLLPAEIGTTILAPAIGLYQVKRSTAECSDFASAPIQVNILEGTQISLISDKTSLFCNENFTIKIDTANSSLPIGIPVQFDWFRDNNSILLNSNQSSRTDTQAGTYKLRMKTSLIPNECQSFDSDVITIENQNLILSLSPITSENTLIICNGIVATLQTNKNLSQDITYKWFKNSTLIADQTLPNLILNNEPGIYQVRGSIGGCVDIASNNLTVSYAGNSSEVATISSVQNLNQTFCGGDTLELNATGCSSGVLWSFGSTGNNVIFNVSNNTNITASCVGSCLGSESNVLNVLGKGFDGNAPEISYSLLPCSPDYTNIFRTDRVNTQGGIEMIQWKDFSGGGSLMAGNYAGSISENIALGHGPKGAKDFILRRNAHGGPYSYLFGGTGDDELSGFEEITKNKYLVYGTTNSANNGNIISTSFGQKDFWLFRWNFQTSQVEWQKRFGGSLDDVLVKSIRLSNGDFILAGYSNSTVNGNKTATKFGESDYWVIRIDSLGNKIWEKTYGGTGTETLADIYRINNNQFALFGTSNSPISGNKTMAAYNGSKDYWVVWIDGNGDLVNQKQYGGSLDDIAGKMVYYNTTLFLVGSSFSGISNNKTQANRGDINTSDYWVIRISESSGDIFWNKTLGSSATETAMASVLTMENNLVIWGSSNAQASNFEKISAAKDLTSNPARMDGWLIEIDIDGNRITDYTLGGCTSDIVSPVAVLSQTGNIVVGISADETCASVPLYSNNTLNSFHAPQLISFGKCQFTNTRSTIKDINVLVRMKPPNTLINSFNKFQDDLEDIEEYQWNNGQTNFYFQTLTSCLNNGFNVKYRLKGQSCFSRKSEQLNIVYEDNLILAGQLFPGIEPTKIFAYKSIESNQKLFTNYEYKSDGNINLLPGFEISAAGSKVFKAEIGGCEN